MISGLGEAGLIHSGLAWLRSTPTCMEDWGVGSTWRSPQEPGARPRWAPQGPRDPSSLAYPISQP